MDNDCYLFLLDNKGNLKQNIQLDPITAQVSRDDVTTMIEECAERNIFLMVTHVHIITLVAMKGIVNSREHDSQVNCFNGQKQSNKILNILRMK